MSTQIVSQSHYVREAEDTRNPLWEASDVPAADAASALAPAPLSAPLSAPTKARKHMGYAPSIPYADRESESGPFIDTDPGVTQTGVDTFCWALLTVGFILFLCVMVAQCKMTHPNLSAVMAAQTVSQQRSAMLSRPREMQEGTAR